jgi:CheY-like chemotaxis protein
MASSERGVELPRSRVLVVDDFPDAAEVTCMMLALLGHDSEAAHSGYAALAAAMRFEPDVAIVDLALPDISGLEVGRELRRRSRRRTPLYLAALTDWSSTGLRGRTADAGFDQLVVKPTRKAALVALLRQAHAARSAPHGEMLVVP